MAFLLLPGGRSDVMMDYDKMYSIFLGFYVLVSCEIVYTILEAHLPSE